MRSPWGPGAGGAAAKLPRFGQNHPDLGRTIQIWAKPPRFGQNSALRCSGFLSCKCCPAYLVISVKSLGIFLPSMISLEAPILTEGILFHPVSVPVQTEVFCLGVSDLHSGFAGAGLVNTKVEIERLLSLVALGKSPCLKEQQEVLCVIQHSSHVSGLLNWIYNAVILRNGFCSGSHPHPCRVWEHSLRRPRFALPTDQPAAARGSGRRLQVQL